MKSCRHPFYQQSPYVILRVRMWIEIDDDAFDAGGDDVILRVRMWIEIVSLLALLR